MTRRRRKAGVHGCAGSETYSSASATGPVYRCRVVLILEKLSRTSRCLGLAGAVREILMQRFCLEELALGPCSAGIGGRFGRLSIPDNYPDAEECVVRRTAYRPQHIQKVLVNVQASRIGRLQSRCIHLVRLVVFRLS